MCIFSSFYLHELIDLPHMLYIRFLKIHIYDNIYNLHLWFFTQYVYYTFTQKIWIDSTQKVVRQFYYIICISLFPLMFEKFVFTFLDYCAFTNILNISWNNLDSSVLYFAFESNIIIHSISLWYLYIFNTLLEWKLSRAIWCKVILYLYVGKDNRM